MVITTFVIGFTLWLFVRTFLRDKRGGLAVAVFFACLFAGLFIDAWLNADAIRIIAARL